MKDTFFGDGIRNLAAGLMSGNDKSQMSQYTLHLANQFEIEAAYKTSSLAKRIIDLPAKDATRRWRGWSANPEQISAIEKIEKRLQIQQHVRRAIRGARTVGVSALYLSVSDVEGNPERRSQKIDFSTLGVNCLRRVSIIPRRRLTPGPIDMDPDSEYYGGPEYYIMTTNTEMMRVHPSRLAIFYGDQHTSDDDDSLSTTSVDGWHADSVLQAIFDTVKSTDSAMASVASMLFEAKIDVYSIPDLMAQLQENPEYEQTVIERFGLANRMKSVNNALLLDTLEEHEGKQLTFSGVSEVLEKFFQAVSGAAEIPVTRLFGRSPSGLNATGESDIRLYYDNVAGIQTNDIDPAIDNLNRLLKISATGTDDEKIFYTWKPLWSMDETAKSKIAKEAAETGKIMVEMGFTRKVAVSAVSNSLIESEVMPGLESIIREEGGIEKIFTEKSAEGGEQTPPNPQSAAEIIPFRRNVGDAAPRTLYIRRNVLNAEAIIKHYADQGVGGLYDPSELHVTIIYSRGHYDWMKLPPPYESEVKLPRGGARVHEVLGDSYSALLFRSYDLEWRNETLQRFDVDTDYPDYQPHISLGRNLNLDGIVPWDRTIVLGHEIWEEVKED